ncbi:hypothetical protein IWQ62_000744 [Dispira parvispora]|uniref:Inositol phospholipid synthesis and fat-storage-inducing TM-domain-containing protein n=1 Tax=Dispira parvispora TaxID=1520584 RepID=A0A9W8AU09_9FUNG|nr:hypothetical protein IWQ62_000744 [Dispira parvispora]
MSSFATTHRATSGAGRPRRGTGPQTIISGVTVALILAFTVLMGTLVKEWIVAKYIILPPGNPATLLQASKAAVSTAVAGATATATTTATAMPQAPLPVDPFGNVGLGQPWWKQCVLFLADKRNVLNQVFGKWGWGWTTAVFMTYVLAVINPHRRRAWLRFGLRWLAATLYWHTLTQWAWGPPVFDRVFVASGGQCTSGGATVQTYHHCRQAGGYWQGGHDISGHCMLLAHASLFLWEELGPFIFHITAYRRFHTTWTQRLVSLGVVVFLALWYTLLISTATFYHTVYEKVTGIFFGLLYWLVAYQLLFPNTIYPGMPHQTVEDVLDEKSD